MTSQTDLASQHAVRLRKIRSEALSHGFNILIAAFGLYFVIRHGYPIKSPWPELMKTMSLIMGGLLVVAYVLGLCVCRLKWKNTMMRFKIKLAQALKQTASGTT